MSSIQMTLEERVAALEQSVAEMKQSAVGPVKVAKQSKKAKKAEAAEGGSDEPKPAKEPTAWNLMVTATVSEMRQNGWTSWTDLKGVIWPASKPGVTVRVKDKKGAESDSCVFDGGEHDGKPPSPALGGMVRASYLKSLTDPVAKANAEAYHAKLAEKRSNASTGSGAKEEPVADAPEAGKKGGRPKMTEEQKAAAKVKRDAKKAAEAAAAAAEEVEMAAEEEDEEAEEGFEEVEAEEAEAEEAEEAEESHTPVPPPPAPKPVSIIKASVGGGGSAPAAAAAPPPPKSRYGPPPPKIAGSSMAAIRAGVNKSAAAPKKAEAPKKVDISLFPWTFKGTEYYTNDRKDVVDVNTGSWVGRFNGSEIDESVEEPADFANGVPMREVA